jgi:ribosomal-protein-alanine N-acetyltransferase
MADLILQPARMRDAGSIAAMSRRYVEAGLSPAWTVERVVRSIRHRDSTVLTATSCRALAGIAIMQYGDTSAHLNLLAVVPAYRRKGIGRRMLQWLESAARVAGTFVISLEVRAGNGPATRFYEALGYRQSGLITGYYEGVEDAIRMRRDLSVSAATLR